MTLKVQSDLDYSELFLINIMEEENERYSNEFFNENVQWKRWNI
jgi:hypothetical protein